MKSPVPDRRRLRALRRALSVNQQRFHASALARRLGRELRFLRARRIAFYWPADGEMDPRPLMQGVLRSGRACYLPCLQRPTRFGARRGTLWFARYRPGGTMRPNRFGIPEPRSEGQRRLRAMQLDLILMPLVGFDAQGHRIGMGGGFYDRTLSYLRHRRHWKRPYLIGIAHECQRLARIEPRPWDIQLDAVATESRLYRRTKVPRADSNDHARAQD